MLVKELRQGMRTHLFSVSFILLQGVMVLTVLLGTAAEHGSDSLHGVFWFFVSTTMLIVMPIRGFSALANEVRLNTMDLIMLTRLSAWRIALGKWAALLVQTLLFFTAILPYVVMRYFFGGVNLLEEIFLIFSLFVLSAVLTAVTVGMSAFRGILIRGAVAVVLMITTFSLITGASNGWGVDLDFTDPDFWWGTLAMLITSVYAIYFFLDMGASRIAPAAENHSTRKRLIAWAFVIVALLIPVFSSADSEPMFVMAFVVMAVVWVDALTEQPVILPSILAPFLRFKPVSFSRFFLTPGWHTGLLYFLLSWVILGVFLMVHKPFYRGTDSELLMACINLGTAIIFPLLFIQTFLPRTTNLFGMYVLVQCIIIVTGFFLSSVIGEIAGYGNDVFFYIPLPFVYFVHLMENPDDVPALAVFLTAVMLAGSLFLPLLRALPLFRSMSQVSNQIRHGDASVPEGQIMNKIISRDES